ncbi:hypothetical protein KBB08_00255 [Candidatus Gracilibacteria bacterium]|nr:hypothetical protein [Candidatus Gracilibacteria bacterium]
MLRMLDDNSCDGPVFELREPKAPETQLINLTPAELADVRIEMDRIVFPNGHVFARLDPNKL